MPELTPAERQQIAEILRRRANDIASYKMRHIKDDEPASVEFALSREISRLRRLAERVNPPAPDAEEADD